MTIKFGADTTGFKKGTDEMISKLNDLNKELVNNQYKQKDCNKIINDAQKELNNIRKSIKEKGQADAEQEKRIKKLTETIEEQKVNLSQLRTEQISIRQAISSTSSEVAKSNQGWTVLKGTLANLSSEVLSTLGRKLLEVGKNVVSVGEQFTASMSEVQAISGASAEDMERLEAAAREYGATTKFTASESAQALKYMALAGWDTNESISALGGVLDLAAAGGMDLARASDIVTDYITAFGLSAKDSSEFVDTMAYAMAHSNTNVEQLGEAYKNCAATAASMGFSVQDVTAVLMTMANAGVKGGEAGTTLNTILTRLATDTKGCATELKQFGVEIYDSGGSLKSLSSILEGVSGAFSTLNQEQQANLSKMIAGTNQYSGFQTIMQGLSESAKEAGSSFNDYAQQLENAAGTSKDMAKTMNDNLAGDIKTMQSAFEKLGLKIYEDAEGPLRSLVQTITKDGVPALETLIDHFDLILPVISAVTTATLGYKAAVGIQHIINDVKQAIVGLTAAKTAEKIVTDSATGSQIALNTAMNANPIVLLLTAIASLVVGIGTYSAAVSAAAEDTKKYINAVKEAENTIKDSIESSKAETEVIKTLGEQYEKLRNKVNLSGDEQKELDAVAEQLAEKLGFTTDEIRDQSGAYRELSGEIENVTQKMIAQAQQQAAQNMLTKAIEAQMGAEKQLKDHMKQLDDGQDVDLRFIAELVQQYEQTAEAVEKYKKELSEVNKETAKSLKTTSSGLGGGSKIIEVTGSLKEYNETLKDTEDISKNVIDAFNNMVSAENTLQSAVDEVAEKDKLSLSTLNSIIKKYPELINAVNGYISGLKTEQDVIDGLKNAYENDLDKYNAAINAKAKTDVEFYNHLIANASDLVNEYKNRYSIDLENYKNAESAKLAIKQQAEAQKRAELAKTALQEHSKEDSLENLLSGNDINDMMYSITGDNKYNTGLMFADSKAKKIQEEIDRIDLIAKSAGEQAAREFDSKITNSDYYKNFYGSSYTLKNITASDSKSDKKQQEAEKKEQEERQKQYDLALAAYEKLVNDKIDLMNKESDAAKAAADREIAAIDSVMKKRNEENADKKRQNEIDKINAQLKYAQLDDLSRKELLRKKQDLLNEQYEINYQRSMENKKENIQQQLESRQANIQNSIDILQNNLDEFMLRAAQIAGTQTAAQQVINNNQNQNIQIVQNALSDDQIVNKLIRALVSL